MSHYKFQIRPTCAKDAPGIGRVHVDSWRTTYKGIMSDQLLTDLSYQQRTDGALRRFQNPEIDSFVAVDASERIVGFADIGPSREKNLSAEGELYAIYLLKELQGKGLGRKLFEAAFQQMIKRNFKDFFVSVFSQNLSAVNFYRKMGGQWIGHDHFDLEGVRHKTDTFLWTCTD